MALRDTVKGHRCQYTVSVERYTYVVMNFPSGESKIPLLSIFWVEKPAIPNKESAKEPPQNLTREEEDIPATAETFRANEVHLNKLISSPQVGSNERLTLSRIPKH